MMMSSYMVYSCFVFSFDAILEIIIIICSFVANLRVGSPGASELHYFENVFLMDAVKMMLFMTSSFPAFIRKISKCE